VFVRALGDVIAGETARGHTNIGATPTVAQGVPRVVYVLVALRADDPHAQQRTT
jgi:hypothetical protein